MLIGSEGSANGIEISIQTKDGQILRELFGSDQPNLGDRTAISEGANIEYVSATLKPGISVSEFIITLSLNLGAGISASLIANWIYDRIMKKNKTSIIVKQERKILITKDDIEIFLIEKIEESRV